jgi:hypothetical protein
LPLLEVIENKGNGARYQDRGDGKTEKRKVTMENGEDGERERRRDGSE